MGRRNSFFHNMLQVPDHVLEKLHCVNCGGYLSCGPIVINKQNEQTCGRCFHALSEQEKSQCVREIGLEAVSELLSFPCKYNSQGCTHTFAWNRGTEHELTCAHRNNSLPLHTHFEENAYFFRSADIEMKVSCDSASIFNDDKLKIKLEVSGQEDKKLYLGNNSIPVQIKGEVVVCLDTTPKITYCHVTSENIEEPVYDTIAYTAGQVKCVNCQKNIFFCEIFQCAFGHNLCKNCKNHNCQVCGFLPTSIKSSHFCKNYAKGCTDLFPTCDIAKHEIDCEFNSYKCVLCDFTDSVKSIYTHFVENHDVILSNQLNINFSRKDQNWYFYCHEKLFVCKYYNFIDTVEFIVSYIGSNDTASKYNYKVSLLEENRTSTKKSKCLGWNEVSLGKGVFFEITNNMKKNLQFHIVIDTIY